MAAFSAKLLICASLMATVSASHASEQLELGREFLNQEPGRKTKRVVVLTGIHSIDELDALKQSIDDIIMYIRLFGLSKYTHDKKIINSSPRQHPRFIEYTHISLRDGMEIIPHSNMLADRIGDWRVVDRFDISFTVDFAGWSLMNSFPPGSKPIPPGSFRMHGHPGGCNGHWCLGAIERLK
jgi:hypothetical protein